MSDKPQARELSAHEIAHFEALAVDNPRMADMLKGAREFCGDRPLSLTQGQYDWLQRDVQKFPLLLNGHAVLNKRATCFFRIGDKKWCDQKATEVVGRVGVCRKHRAEQERVEQEFARKRAFQKRPSSLAGAAGVFGEGDDE